MAQSKLVTAVPMSHSTSICDLPYELLVHIFTHARGTDIVNLMCTARHFYQFHQDEYIWKLLCTRYNAPRLDFFEYPNLTYYALYSGILHTYGPLIGLWAGDAPFRGNIFEFRYIPQGIIGEVWRFPGPRLDHLQTNLEKTTPQLPTYFESVRITLSSSSKTDNSSSGFEPCVTWHVYPENQHWLQDPCERPSLHVLSPTQQSYQVYITYPSLEEERAIDSRRSEHPEFPPSSHAVWYDGGRDLPRLRQETSPTYDDFNAVKMRCRYHEEVLFGAKTEHVKPASLAIFPPPHVADRMELHAPPFVGLSDMREVSRGSCMSSWEAGHSMRYYPLRSPDIPDSPEVDPALPEWKPESLEGLWFAAAWTNCTEVLYLEYVPGERKVIAWKITGNVCVPRGAIAWQFSLGSDVDVGSPSASVFRDLPSTTRIYHGEMTESYRGFFSNYHSELTIALPTKDDIYFRVGNKQHVFKCRRYRGRNFDIEQEAAAGIRKPVPQLLL
ncbi:hypothetical protein K474DRAFT_1663003 [Panus rudis PR-1116 ss-1]|nr:hypothetical protein K474DRAFT_1663003 [Panus rudis PR-1116 ss-1]